MKTGFTYSAGLLALLCTSACTLVASRVPAATPTRSAPPAVIQIPEEAAAPEAMSVSTASQATESPWPTSRRAENVAIAGVAQASANEEEARLAIDGDPETHWNANLLGMQWLTVSLDALHLATRIELVVEQMPAGPTTHEVWLGNGSGMQTLHRRFSEQFTEQGQVLTIELDPPVRVDAVSILTLNSPSWVAWGEVRVIGVQAEEPQRPEGVSAWRLQRVAGGLEKPVHLTHAGDGSGRLFVVEHPGRIRIVKDGSVAERPFLDITDRVKCCGEEGLVGLAFPAGYANTGLFYVGYTNAVGATTVSRFASTSDPDAADPGSEEVLLTVSQPRDNHNGGHMAFGPRDGYLYIGIGDGGETGVVVSPGLGLDTLLGKILRIDVGSGPEPYRVPSENPFLGVAGFRGEVWASGVRNPWGFAFDPATGDLYITDVGDALHEEISFQPASSAGGEDYGWPAMEGHICSPFFPTSCSTDGLTLPVAAYGHSEGCAIVGGAVYRGTKHAHLNGAFVYGDFCSGRIWALKRTQGSNAGFRQETWHAELLLLGQAAVPMSKVGAGEEGSLYALNYMTGSLYEITDR